MSNIDNRVVSMQFDNAAFEARVSSTIAALDKLSAKIALIGAPKGFNDVTAAANAVDLTKMASGVDNISSKFTAMGAIGFAAIQKITQSVMGFASNFVKTDILGPIISGGTTRAQNIEQAQFQFRGLGMNVEEVMKNALDAVRGTAYGLGDAAKAAAQFGASGLAAGPKMTQSLRAIAGAAAMTGSSYNEMSALFTSSAATGKITNQDFMQFATRGLNAAAVYGKAVNKTEAQVHQMATAGDVDYASFAKAMDDAFGAHATQANETFSGSLANMHAALSRLGAAFIGPKEQQQRDLYNALTPVIDNVTAALKPLISAFLEVRGIVSSNLITKLKGLDFTNFNWAIPNFAEAFKLAFAGVTQFFGVIRDAFREIFPPSSVSLLVTISNMFLSFAEKLKMGGDTAFKVRELFAGFFSILAIGWEVIKNLVSFVERLMSAITPAGSGLLDFAANGANMLTRLKLALVDGGAITDFFYNLEDVIKGAIGFIQNIKDKIVDFFSVGSGFDAVSGSVDRVSGRLDSLSAMGNRISGAWQKVVDFFQKGNTFLDPIWNYIKTWFSELGGKLAKAFGPTDFNGAVDVINVGLLGGITLMLSKFMSGGVKFGLQGGFLTKINMAIGGVTRSLQAMQTNLKASALLKIAAAMALLTASIVVLSMIDSDKLTKALLAMTVGFGLLVGTMTLLDKAIGNGSAVKLGILGAAMIELSVAILIIAAAMKIFASMSWEDLAKGFVGLAGSLVAIALAMKLMPSGPSMITQSAGLMAIGVALGLIALSMKIFATMSWTEMAKGFVGVGGGLALIAGAMHLMPSGTGMILQSAGLLAIGVALNLIAASMLIFARMSWEELGKGIVGVGGGLLVIAGAMHLMPNNLPLTAAGVLILSIALGVMAQAIKSMGSMDIATLAKGIGAFAATLLILVVAMKNMESTPAGAAAMVVVAAAMFIMAKVLQQLGSMSITDIVTGLGAMAGIFVVLGLAGKLLEPVIPSIFSLGIAMMAVGGGFALFGLGAMLVVQALEMLAVAGPKGAQAMVDSIMVLIKALPLMAAGAALGVVSFVNELLKAAPVFLKLLTVLLDQILQTIITEAPKIGEAFIVLISTALKVLRAAVPDFIRTAFELITAFLTGLRDNIGPITTLAIDIVVNFLKSLTAGMPQLVTAGVDFIVAFLEGIAKNVGKIIVAGTDIIINFIKGIGAAALRIAVAAAEMLITFLNGLAAAIRTYTPQIMQAGLNVATALLEGMLAGLGFIGKIAAWFGGLIGKVLGWIGDTFGPIVSKGVDLLAGFLSGILQGALGVVMWLGALGASIIGWIGDMVGTIVSKGVDLLGGFLTGVLQGALGVVMWFGALGSAIIGWIGDMVGTIVGKGADIIGGFLAGVLKGALDVIDWFHNLAAKVHDWIGDVVGKLVEKGKDILGGFFTGILQKAFEMVTWLTGLGGNILSWIGNIGESLLEVGKAVIQGLWNGMKAVWEKVKEWLGKLNPVSWFHDIGILDGHGLLLLVPIGENLMIGLQNGMKKEWDVATKWLGGLNPGKVASALQSTVDQLSITEDFNPVITPVLDLTKVQAASGAIAGYLGVSSLSPGVSFGQANLIATTTDLAKTVVVPPAYTGPTTVTFEQSIYAPSALSTNDIYRNTKSQIALAKEELGIS